VEIPVRPRTFALIHACFSWRRLLPSCCHVCLERSRGGFRISPKTASDLVFLFVAGAGFEPATSGYEPNLANISKNQQRRTISIRHEQRQGLMSLPSGHRRVPELGDEDPATVLPSKVSTRLIDGHELEVDWFFLLVIPNPASSRPSSAPPKGQNPSALSTARPLPRSFAESRGDDCKTTSGVLSRPLTRLKKHNT
jgi:hypothetical protein